MKNKAFNKWTDFYLNSDMKDSNQLYPSENLIRMLKGNYIKNLNKNYKGKKVIDIGFGSGNNLFFLNQLEMDLYGTEVSDEICKEYVNKLKKFNINVKLKEGFNSKLPFNNGFFDYLISWNVIHYENSESKMKNAIKEYSRVMKKNGRIFISTTGPDHSILRGAKLVDNHLYQIKRKDNFRENEIYFYFDNEYYINKFFQDDFKEIQIARTTTNLFSEINDWFLITALKK